MLGNGRLEATCFDGSKRLCHIRGKLRKKVIVEVVISNFVLLFVKRMHFYILLKFKN